MPASETFSTESSRYHALERSKSICWNRTADTPEALLASSVLLGELEQSEARVRNRAPEARRKLVATINALSLELYAQAMADSSCFLSYSRSDNAYTPTRYGNPSVTAVSARKVADFLIHAEYAEGERGYWNGPNAGRRARIRATPRLVGFFEGRGITLCHLSRLPTTETIFLTEASRTHASVPFIEYVDTPETNAMRAEVAALNGLLAEIRVGLEPLPRMRDCGNLSSLGNHDSYDRTAIQLCRVFNDGSFAKGGRFYGGWWQGLSRASRSAIRINGNKTVELGFHALHARLCYQLEGRPISPNADPFIISGTRRYPRELVEVAFRRLISAERNSSPRPPKGADKALWLELLRIISDRHSLISEWFANNRRLRLQSHESAIAASVLTNLTSRRIPCLPIHQSFIVRRSDEAALRLAMKAAYWQQMNKIGAVEVAPSIAKGK